MTDAMKAKPATPPAASGVITGPKGTKYLEPQRANAFLGLVRAGDAVARAVDRTLQSEHKLSLHQFEVLLFLAVFAEDQSMQMTELRERTPLSQSRVSRVVAGLETDGLVERTTDPGDNRGVNVTITQPGIDAFTAAQDRHLQDLDEHLFSLLTEREIHQLGAIAAKILAGQPRSN